MWDLFRITLIAALSTGVVHGLAFYFSKAPSVDYGTIVRDLATCIGILLSVLQLKRIESIRSASIKAANRKTTAIVQRLLEAQRSKIIQYANDLHSLARDDDSAIQAVLDKGQLLVDEMSTHITLSGELENTPNEELPRLYDDLEKQVEKIRNPRKNAREQALKSPLKDICGKISRSMQTDPTSALLAELTKTE